MEIKKVFSDLGKDKAWGPNGFSFGFFQNCYEVVKEDILEVFR